MKRITKADLKPDFKDPRIDYQDGDLDDVSVNKVRLFRMERMDDGSFWIRLYRDGARDIVFWLNSNARITGKHEYD